MDSVLAPVDVPFADGLFALTCLSSLLTSNYAYNHMDHVGLFKSGASNMTRTDLAWNLIMVTQ